MFQRERTGHDLAVDRPQGFRIHRPLVQRGDFFEHDFFPFGHIDRRQVAAFQFADLLDGCVTFVQQLHDLRIDLIDFFAQIIQIHKETPFSVSFYSPVIYHGNARSARKNVKKTAIREVCRQAVSAIIPPRRR